MNEKSSFKFMIASNLCPRFKNTDIRCVNEADCVILKSAGIPCPYDFDTGTSGETKGGNTDGSSSGMESWVYILIAAIVVLIICAVIIIAYFKRHNSNIKVR